MLRQKAQVLQNVKAVFHVKQKGHCMGNSRVLENVSSAGSEAEESVSSSERSGCSFLIVTGVMTRTGRGSGVKMSNQAVMRPESERSRVVGGRRWYKTMARSLKHGPRWWGRGVAGRVTVESEESAEAGVLERWRSC